ncbi:hypothetical protein TRAPUB_12044, partial [Trametes pubescens]
MRPVTSTKQPPSTPSSTTPQLPKSTSSTVFAACARRLTGGKSLDDFFGAVRNCGVNIQQDPAVRRWVDAVIAHLRKSLDEAGYARRKAAQKSDKLRKEWSELLDKDSDKGREWKEDIAALKREASEFPTAIEQDEEFRAVRRAQTKLGEDLENGT